MGRLMELGREDLSAFPGLADRVLEALAGELPRRVLGLTLKSSRQAARIEALIRTLAGTDTAAVRSLLSGIAARFAGQQFAQLAAETLAGLGRSSVREVAPSATMTGDLELFGLPGLLQSLTDSRTSGDLTIVDSSGVEVATFQLTGGLLTAATAGDIEGPCAFYQLIQRPRSARFVFIRSELTESAAAAEGRPVMPMMLEGMRRYDEFERAVVLVPDGSRFEPTGENPSAVPDEDDGSLVKTVWDRATGGNTAVECEHTLGVDSFRIRRILEHWVVTGALSLR